MPPVSTPSSASAGPGGEDGGAALAAGTAQGVGPGRHGRRVQAGQDANGRGGPAGHAAQQVWLGAGKGGGRAGAQQGGQIAGDIARVAAVVVDAEACEQAVEVGHADLEPGGFRVGEVEGGGGEGGGTAEGGGVEPGAGDVEGGQVEHETGRCGGVGLVAPGALPHREGGGAAAQEQHLVEAFHHVVMPGGAGAGSHRANPGGCGAGQAGGAVTGRQGRQCAGGGRAPRGGHGEHSRGGVRVRPGGDVQHSHTLPDAGCVAGGVAPSVHEGSLQAGAGGAKRPRA